MRSSRKALQRYGFFVYLLNPRTNKREKNTYLLIFVK